MVPTQDIKVLWASAWSEVSRLRCRKCPRSQGTPQDRKFETGDLQSLAARSKYSRFLYFGGDILKVWCGEDHTGRPAISFDDGTGCRNSHRNLGSRAGSQYHT